jgi:hypothetical protein
VVDEGATALDLTLPTGTWVHWWSGDAFTGGKAISVQAQLGEGPLFQRSPSAIPMLRRTVETLSPVEDDSVDSWFASRGSLNARVIPGAGAAFRLATGESVVAESLAAVELSSGSDYSGWDVEIYAPGASEVSYEGVALAPGTDDCETCFILDDPWIRVIAPPGSGTLSVQ